MYMHCVFQSESQSLIMVYQMLILILVCLHDSLAEGEAWFPTELPDYCSGDMSAREIPLLTPQEQEQIDKLLQVQVVIRHGARTPYMKYSCWKEYNIPWDNCNVTEVMYTSPSPYESSTNWLFRKKYDGSPNSLGGSCKTGQLLEAGFEQESANGRMLQKAYIGNEKHHLLKSHEWDLNDPSKMYFRSDDEQRTLMSGQSLVHSLFDIHIQEIIDWHTGDYLLDTLYPNSRVCPRLDNISSEAFASEGYLSSPMQLNKQKLERDLNIIFGEGYWDWTFMIDCLMTSVCSGHGIPSGDSNSDSGEGHMSKELFTQVTAYQEFDYFYKMTFDNSFYSKLAMSNVVYTLRMRLEEAMHGDSSAMEFVLYAGHDTTLMPLLAVLLTKELWDGKWAPYGALLALELYRANKSAEHTDIKFLFRLVYNGKPLILKSCPGALCDVSILLDILSFGQKETPTACKPLSTSHRKNEETTVDATLHYSNKNNNNTARFSFNFVCVSIFLTAVLTCSLAVTCTYAFLGVNGKGSPRNGNVYGSSTQYSRIDHALSTVENAAANQYSEDAAL